MRGLIRTQKLPRHGRVMRNPQHSFQIRTRPFQIAPFAIAPVLPGETMKSARLQARVITDPIKSRFVGWWQEHYLFYVKHRDMPNSEKFQEMVLNPDADMSSAMTDTGLVEHYLSVPELGAKIDWVAECLEAVVTQFFRDQDDAWNNHMVGNLPSAKVIGDTWMQSMVTEANGPTFPEDVAVDGADGSTPDDTITVAEIDAARAQYEFLRQNEFIDMTYEDYLATYGVRPARPDKANVPELLRYTRNWQYPVSAINPEDGSAASAVAWNVSERADKDRLFKEPGFIFGVSVTRPKVYFSKQTSSAVSLLDDAYAWLPAVLLNDMRTSLKLVPDLAGPLGDVTDANGYWVDIRDLFLYGEQFVNFALTETDAGLVALPTPGLEKQYASATDADALFAGASPANLIRQDGLLTLAIAGHQVDQTPYHVVGHTP